MAQTKRRLADDLEKLDGKKYGAYKRVKGTWRFGIFRLVIDYVQGDPYAAPSRLRLLLPPETPELPASLLSTPDRRTAVANFLNRRLAKELREESRSRGSGKSGRLEILEPGQQVLRRSSFFVDEEGGLTVRFRAGLPARGRRILGRQAKEMLCDAVPKVVEATLVADAIDAEALESHVLLHEDSLALRDQLAGKNLVAFIPNGASLPRRSGIDDRPMPAERATPFSAPDSLTVTLDQPNAGPIRGMGIPEGITLIVGGGYHGKSTLLQAIERGVYDHVAGDGRERVVTRPDAVKIRAEDGRRIEAVDIGNFIDNLPGGEDTRAFSTENASGSTSQAAAIAEALEAGTSTLLIDEDTSATNFMIRDARMQALIATEDEPITPFIDRARELCDDHGISTVLVVGGAGDYFDVADTVIGMKAYVPHDRTDDAKRIAADLQTERTAEGRSWQSLGRRCPDPSSINPRKGKRAVSIKLLTDSRVRFGTEELDLSSLEQIVETGQVRTIANALVALRHESLFDGNTDVRSGLEALERKLETEGLVSLAPGEWGEFADVRRLELAAALNRLRTLRVHTD